MPILWRGYFKGYAFKFKIKTCRIKVLNDLNFIVIQCCLSVSILKLQTNEDII